MMALLLLDFATITCDKTRIMQDLRSINSNVREMKVRGESFSRRISESTSETYYSMSGYLGTLLECDMTAESRRQLNEFVNLFCEYHIHIDKQLQLDILHLVSWLSAINLQVKQMIYTKTVSREVAFAECFSLTPSEQDAQVS